MRYLKLQIFIEEKNGKIGLVKNKESTLNPIEEIGVFELLKKESLEKINKSMEIKNGT